MKRAGRYAGGKRPDAGAVVYRDESTVQKVRWTNPLRGDARKATTAEVKVAKSGVFVGFRMRF